ncbi:ParA family protein [Halovenus sp. HT40]|uniref:ParA family protein n=1 Tax=Halovenus sp. HT40 TaxID=3126691 RepID=UPI00300EEF5B
MLSYATYSEAGGVGKTTLAANLAKAHERAGLDVLVVPLDPQDGNLSYYYGVDDERDADVDTLVRHMIDRGTGEFDDLIRTAEGIDIVPEHNMLSSLGQYLDREKQQAEELGESFGIHAQLLRVLRENNVNEEYDVLICDPPATEGPHLYNAINATRSLCIPLEPSPKGNASVGGLESLVEGFSAQFNADVSVLATVPIEFKDTRDQNSILADVEYSTPEIIGERASLFEGSWGEHCSAFTYVAEHRSRVRDYEVETLAKLDRIARHLESTAGIEAPNPPEPGELQESEAIAGDQQ